MTSENSMHEAGHPKLVLWDIPEGWSGEGIGRGFQEGEHTWLIHVDVWQNPPQYCKVIILQLKPFFSKKNKLPMHKLVVLP